MGRRNPALKCEGEITRSHVDGQWTHQGTLTGPNFTHAHPPSPENTLLGVGGCIKGGGRTKFLPRGASKYTPPPPSTGKMPLWPENRGEGGGGGVYNFALDTLGPNRGLYLYQRVPHWRPWTAINGQSLCLNSTSRSRRTLETVEEISPPKPVSARISEQEKKSPKWGREAKVLYTNLTSRFNLSHACRQRLGIYGLMLMTKKLQRSFEAYLE